LKIFGIISGQRQRATSVRMQHLAVLVLLVDVC
jgi:hypothetical protein